MSAPVRPPRRTYEHLEGLGRVPTPYDLATTGLLPRAPLAVDVPCGAWIMRHRDTSTFRPPPDEVFADPRHVTYATYVANRAGREHLVGGLLAQLEELGADRTLAAPASRLLTDLLSPLRFPMHALMMTAAYVGQLAPSGRVVALCAAQAGDEVRRIQRIAYRVVLHDKVRGLPRADGRTAWLDAPAWQRLRRVVEELLVTWDLGAAFATLALVVKPAIDALVHEGLETALLASGDHFTPKLLHDLGDDARWHAQWAHAYGQAAIAHHAGNRDVLAAAIAARRPAITAAIDALARAFLDDRTRARVHAAALAPARALGLEGQETPA